MQLNELCEMLCELYDAAREFIETYVIEDYEDLTHIHKVKSFAIEYVI